MGYEPHALLSSREYRWLKAVWITALTVTSMLWMIGLLSAFFLPSAAVQGLHGMFGTVVYDCVFCAAPAFGLFASLLTLLGASPGAGGQARPRLLWAGLLVGLFANVAGIAAMRLDYQILWLRAEDFGPGVRSAIYLFGKDSYQKPAIIWFILVEMPLIYVAVAMLVRGRRACSGCTAPAECESAKANDNDNG